MVLQEKETFLCREGKVSREMESHCRERAGELAGGGKQQRESGHK